MTEEKDSSVAHPSSAEPGEGIPEPAAAEIRNPQSDSEAPKPNDSAFNYTVEPASARIPTASGKAFGAAPKRRLGESSEKILYFFALLGGSAVILFGKTGGWLGRWEGALFSVGCIVAYFIVAHLSTRENHARSDRLGDNCYYLGLVYTLASLIAALILIERGAEVRSLLSNFGIALVSTAAGIIARLIMMQLRSETDDVDQRARIALAETANLMKSDMLEAASAFRTLVIGAHETMAISVERTERSFDVAKSLSDRMAKLEVSPEALNDALTRIVAQLEDAGAKIAEAGGALANQSRAVATTAGSIERADAGLARIDAVLTQMTASVGKQHEATELMLRSLTEQQSYIRSYRDAMEQDAKRAREAAEKVYSALGDLAHTIVTRVQP